MADTENTTAKLAEVMSGIRFAMLTTVDSDGTMTARPMATQDTDFGGDLWFIASRDSRKVAHIQAQPHVGVTLSSTDAWVSIDGHATVVTDQAKLDELWNPGVEAWFPDGKDDPAIVLIKVTGDSAEYWDNPGGRVATVFSLAKAKLTCQPYSGGENETVEL